MIYIITGGAGSLGRRLTEELLKPEYEATAIRVFDNNENGIARMRWVFRDDPRLRWLIGDIRDKDRLLRAFDGVDVVVHAAALKHVDIGETNPAEQIKTNVIGTLNCIEAAIDKNVGKFLLISSDKSVQACSTYGRCKSLGESLTLDANIYVGDGKRTCLSVCRPPNYLRSDGSVTEIWDYQMVSGLPLTVTDKRCVRYFMTFEEIVAFIIKAIKMMKGGEIFIPNNCKPTNIYDLAKEYGKGHSIKFTGLRTGERLEELLIDPLERQYAEVIDDILVVRR